MSVEVARNRGRPWTRELDELLLELDEAGATRERMAEVLGRTVAAVDAHLQELRQRLDDTPGCRTCAYYSPSRQWCVEWSQPVAPDYHCGRYQSERGEGSPVRTYRLEEARNVASQSGIIWLDRTQGWGAGYVTLPQPGRRSSLYASVRLGVAFTPDGEQVRIGCHPGRREIVLRRDPNGPYRVGPANQSAGRQIAGPHQCERIRSLGLPPGRYYLDEQRSDDKTLILVYREDEAS